MRSKKENFSAEAYLEPFQISIMECFNEDS